MLLFIHLSIIHTNYSLMVTGKLEMIPNDFGRQVTIHTDIHN